MKKLTTILSSLALAALGGFFFASCTNPSSPATTVGAPSNLMALSKDANTISIKWTRGANDTAAEKVILSSTAVTDTLFEPSSVTQLDLNVSEGVLYTMTVVSSGGSSNSITWMTAVRTSGLQIYQFSSGQKSGLQLNGPGGQATVVSASSSNIGTMDFYLEDVQHDNTITTASGLSFEGAQFLNNPPTEVWRNSFLDGTPRYVPGGLNADYSGTSFSSQFATMIPDSVNTFDIPNDAAYGTTGSRVLLVRTQDGNFAKIEIVPDLTTGQLYSGSGTNKYITVNVSYQPVVGQAYAARPHPHYSGKPIRISAQ